MTLNTKRLKVTHTRYDSQIMKCQSISLYITSRFPDAGHSETSALNDSKNYLEH